MGPDTLNLIEEKTINMFEPTGTRKDSLNRTLVSQALRQTVDKWDHMKLKCSVQLMTSLFE